MEEIKAVGSDIIGLFDTIRSQAEEYNYAFEAIRRETREVTHQRSVVQQALQQFQKRHEMAVVELTELMEDGVAAVEEKARTTEAAFKELSEIQKLRTVLEQLKATFGSHNTKLEAAISGLNKLVGQKVSEEFANLERKVAHRLKQDQEDIAMFDKRLQALQDYQRRELTSIGEDVNDFKSKITETKYIVDETQKIVEMMISQAETEIQAKIEYMQVMVENHQKSLKAPAQRQESLAPEAAENTSAAIAKYEKRIKDLEKKVSSVMNLTMIGATVFLILFVLVAFKII